MFKDKLEQAMKELNLNQAQVVGLTGKSKGSISQYLSGKQIPSEDAQKSIAVSLGLESDYFAKDEAPILKLLKKNSDVIPRIRPEDAGKLMRMHPQNIRRGLEQGQFAWGYAIRTSQPGAEKETYTYFINATRFAEIERIEVPQKMVI